MLTYERTQNSVATPVLSGVTTLAQKISDGTRSESNGTRRGRQQQGPVLVDASVYWWQVDEIRSSHAKNRFGSMPTMPVRFRCIGSLSTKCPKQYRVDLAQALDWLPELTSLELKELGASLTVSIKNKLSLDVAPIAADIIGLQTCRVPN